MKQIIVRRMTLSDLICNVFYKARYWSYRTIFKWKLKNSSPKTKEGLELTFEEEFNEKTWSPSGTGTKWKIGEGWGSYHPRKLNVYYGPPTVVENSSTAKFTVKYKPKTFSVPKRWQEEVGSDKVTIPFEVSLLSSQKSFKQQYGRWECRCTIPFDPGVWPAWWMWGSTWPPEIDIFELYGHKTGKRAGKQAINLHYGSNEEGNRSSTKAWHLWIQRKPAVKFHEWVCEWHPDKIEFFTNGIKVFRFTRKETLEWFNKNTAQMWAVINHSLQASFKPEQDGDYETIDEDFELPTDFTSEFLVDYIRVYKNK